MSDIEKTEPPSPDDVADYCRNMSEELAVIARGAALPALAQAFERASEVASASLDGMQTRSARRAQG